MTTTPITEVTDAAKARLMGGLIGNFTISFAIVHWKIFIYVFSSANVSEKISFINDYLKDLPVFLLYGRPFLLCISLIIAQISAAIVTYFIEIKINNIKWEMRLRSSLDDDKTINDIRILLADAALKLAHSVSNISNLPPAAFQVDQRAVLQEATSNINSVRGLLDNIAKFNIPDFIPRAAHAARNKVRKYLKDNPKISQEMGDLEKV